MAGIWSGRFSDLRKKNDLTMIDGKVKEKNQENSSNSRKKGKKTRLTM